MAQVTTGLRACLSSPRVYDFFQDLMGARSVRKKFTHERVRAIPGCRLLDIGCGTARILDYLVEVDYWGFDPSRRYIDHATSRYGSRGHFNCAMVDKTVIENLDLFDIVIAIGVFHHLDNNQASELVRLAWSALREGGRLVTIDPCITDDQNMVSRFLIDQDRGQNVRTADQYRSLVGSVFPHVEGEVRHRFWIPYTHWIMECQK